jgi:hypothetical protein
MDLAILSSGALPPAIISCPFKAEIQAVALATVLLSIEPDKLEIIISGSDRD